jgi:mannose-6-phosphate isomerase-like protein (cupin superfamily)
MGDFDAIEVLGEARDKTLADIRTQITSWGLTLPAVTPLPLHFGLNNFSKTGETEFWVVNETEHGYCGKFLFVFDGQTCPYHHHQVKHETFFVMKGTLRMKIGQEERLMREGDLLVMPPGLGHSFTGVGPALILEISMPSVPGDSYFEEKSIGANGVI